MRVHTMRLVDASRSSWSQPVKSRPITIRVWSPIRTEGPSPVIVLSHGTGGAAEDLDWLAEALNDAGYLVAAIDHHGNSYNDQYLAEGFAFAWERARDISLLLDHLIDSYEVDAERIGAAGFSIGGYTVAALLGARIDPQAMLAVFGGLVPSPVLPEFPDLVPALRARYSESELAVKIDDGANSFADARIRAGFVLAPAIGRLLNPESLKSITAPLSIRWGDADDIAPPEDNSLVYLNLVPSAHGCSSGAEVGHYEFLGDREDPYGARQRASGDAVEFFASAI